MSVGGWNLRGVRSVGPRRPRPRTTFDPQRARPSHDGQGRNITWSCPQNRPTLMRAKCLAPTISSGGAAFQCPWCTPTRVGDMDKVASEGLNFVGTYGNSRPISTRDRPSGGAAAGDQDMEKLLCVDDDAAELRGTTVRLPHQLARRTMRQIRLSGRHMRISPGQLHGPRPVLGVHAGTRNRCRATEADFSGLMTGTSAHAAGCTEWE